MDRDMARLMAIRKSVVTLTAIILVLASFVGSTVAYLVDTSGSISSLLALNPYVAVQYRTRSRLGRYALLNVDNTSDVNAYVRVKFDVTWANGDVTNPPPVEGRDYTIHVDLGWTRAADGFWYYINPISTGVLNAGITLNGSVDFNVTSCEGVIADDPNIVLSVFGSGVSDVYADGTLVIIT